MSGKQRETLPLVMPGTAAAGQLFQTDATNTLVPISTAGVPDGYVVARNTTTGLWEARSVSGSGGIPVALLDAKGDLIAATANDTAARLAVGTDGKVLTADSAAATGVAWQTPAAGYTDEQAQDAVGAMAASSSTVSLTYVDATPSLTAAIVTSAPLPGSPTTTTQSPGDNSTKVATTAYADAAAAAGTGTYTDEKAQDAIGAMVDGTLVYVDATPLLTRAALTGDVTAAQASNATTIANDAVSFAKMQNIATSRLVGRSTASTGDPEEISLGTGLTMSAGVLNANVVGGAAPTSPPSTSLVRWYKADAGITKDGSDRVSVWADQSAGASDAGQATSGNQPLYVASVIGGLPVVRFTGSRSDRMTLDLTVLPSNNFYIFMVVSRRANGDSYYLGAVTNGTNNQSLHIGQTSSHFYVFNFYNDDIISASVGGTYDTSYPFEILALSRVAGLGRFLRRYQSSLGRGGNGNLTAVLGGGVLGAAIGSYSDKDIAEILIYAGSGIRMSGPDYAQVLAYLAGRYPSAVSD